MTTDRKLAAALLLALPLGACDAGEEVAEHEHGSVVVTQWNDSTELFLEYPHLVAGQQTGNWAIHLSSMKDFKPIRLGSLTVRFIGERGPAEVFEIDSVARDGIFRLDPAVAAPGTYRVELELNSPQVSSRHVLPEVIVFADEASVPHAEEGIRIGDPVLSPHRVGGGRYSVMRGDARCPGSDRRP